MASGSNLNVVTRSKTEQDAVKQIVPDLSGCAGKVLQYAQQRCRDKLKTEQAKLALDTACNALWNWKNPPNPLSGTLAYAVLEVHQRLGPPELKPDLRHVIFKLIALQREIELLPAPDQRGQLGRR